MDTNTRFKEEEHQCIYKLITIFRTIRKLTSPNEDQANHVHRSKPNFKILLLGIVTFIVIANLTIVYSEVHQRHLTSLWVLNIVAFGTSSLGIITLCRYGIRGLHGRSYLYLTLGVMSWSVADLSVLYSYYTLPLEEQYRTSIADVFWFVGYGFLSLHLFTILRSLYKTVKLKLAILVAAFSLLFVSYNVFILVSSENFFEGIDLTALVITLAYPILDLTLIFPSTLILITLRKDYQHSIPWILSSMSLLINAIADDGYVHDFVAGNSEHFWFWDLFYVADFIIIAGALFWYNKYHISYELSKRASRLNK